MTFTYICGPLATLSPARMALYRWAEAHDWPRLPISAWETICGGSADRWQQTSEQMSEEQLQRTQAALAALDTPETEEEDAPWLCRCGQPAVLEDEWPWCGSCYLLATGDDAYLPAEMRVEVINASRVRDRDSFVYVGRTWAGFPASPWGNPCKGANAITGFRHYISHKRPDLVPLLAQELERRGVRKIGCWCTPHDCHGEVLAELVERYWAEQRLQHSAQKGA